MKNPKAAPPPAPPHGHRPGAGLRSHGAHRRPGRLGGRGAGKCHQYTEACERLRRGPSLRQDLHPGHRRREPEHRRRRQQAERERHHHAQEGESGLRRRPLLFRRGQAVPVAPLLRRGQGDHRQAEALQRGRLAQARRGPERHAGRLLGQRPRQALDLLRAHRRVQDRERLPVLEVLRRRVHQEPHRLPRELRGDRRAAGSLRGQQGREAHQSGRPSVPVGQAGRRRQAPRRVLPHGGRPRPQGAAHRLRFHLHARAEQGVRPAGHFHRRELLGPRHLLHGEHLPRQLQDRVHLLHAEERRRLHPGPAGRPHLDAGRRREPEQGEREPPHRAGGCDELHLSRRRHGGRLEHDEAHLRGAFRPGAAVPGR